MRSKLDESTSTTKEQTKNVSLFGLLRLKAYNTVAKHDNQVDKTSNVQHIITVIFSYGGNPPVFRDYMNQCSYYLMI